MTILVSGCYNKDQKKVEEENHMILKNSRETKSLFQIVKMWFWCWKNTHLRSDSWTRRSIKCLYSHYQIKTHWHIFVNCSRFAYSLLIDPSLSIKDFVNFLIKHSSVFVFSSQEQPSSSKPLWVLRWFAFLFISNFCLWFLLILIGFFFAYEKGFYLLRKKL